MYLNLITRSLYTHKYDHGTLVPQIQEAYHTKSIHFLYQCHEKNTLITCIVLFGADQCCLHVYCSRECFVYYFLRKMHNVSNTICSYNITFIRSYATQAHGHKPYIHIHNTAINWENPNIHVHVKTNRKNTLHVQTEILRKKLIIHLTRFDYSKLHFCVQNILSEIAQVCVRVIILFVVKSSINVYIDGLL